MISLVGCTGFVGSNLEASFKFDGLYNSKNITQAFGTNPEILYYSGVPAQKFIANKFPEQDMDVIENAINNIKQINPKKIVLISTVDVYEQPNGKDEDFDMTNQNPEPYGANRLILENYIKENFEDYLIVRLPGLYGKNLKKNFIYDYMQFIPFMLTDAKINSLAEKRADIFDYYVNLENGFYRLKPESDREFLKQLFIEVGFSALKFTDSRGVFQFYNLKYLYGDIQKAMNNNVKVLNIATMPVTINEIYKTLTGDEFVNEILENPPVYNFKTKHSKIFDGENGYIQTKDFVLQDIKEYISEGI